MLIEFDGTAYGREGLFISAQPVKGPGQGIHNIGLIGGKLVSPDEQAQGFVKIAVFLGQRIAHVVEGLIVFWMQGDYVFHNLEGFILVAGFVQQGAQKKGHLRTVRPLFGGLARHLKGLGQLLLTRQQADFQFPELGRVFKLFLSLPCHGQGFLLLARFAKQFYADAYKAAVQIVGGEQYILSAVMHADEINRAMTEALGREVYHYHLHVVYVPVVEKQILWSKRCKDKALVGTVKETVMQVSRSKKWASKPLLDDAGKPVLQKNGKPVLKKSYSILQDDFFNYMHNAGYTDVERGERGSTEEHLTVTQFKVQREQERLDSLTAQADQKAQSLAKTSQTLSKKEKELAAVQKKTTLTKEALIHARDLDYIGKRTFLGNYSLTEEEFSKLKKQADHGYMMDVENRRLKEELSTAKKEAIHWSNKYHDLWYDVKPYLDALHRAPELVRGFLEKILAPKQERTMNVPQRSRKRGQDMEL